MTASDRLTGALALGCVGFETFRQAPVPPLPAVEATRRLKRQRQATGRPSACLRVLIS
jgi:hypothetical protein